MLSHRRFVLTEHTHMFTHQQLGRRSTDQSLHHKYVQLPALHRIFSWDSGSGLGLLYPALQKHKPTVRPKRRDIILWR